MDQGSSKYEELKQKMIQDHINEMTAKGLTCDAQGKCSESTTTKNSSSAIVDQISYKSTQK